MRFAFMIHLFDAIIVIRSAKEVSQIRRKSLQTNRKAKEKQTELKRNKTKTNER